MTDSDSVAPNVSDTSNAPASAVVPALPAPLLLLGGGLVASEVAGRLLHLDRGTMLAGGLLAGGWWLFSRRGPRPVRPRPRGIDGWQERCEGLLAQYGRLLGEEQRDATVAIRRAELGALKSAESPLRPLGVALASSGPPAEELQPRFLSALRGPQPLRLHWGRRLPAVSGDWRWGSGFEACDLVLFHLQRPLRAADLRWLEALPTGQPVWLLLEEQQGAGVAADLGHELLGLWPGAAAERLLRWDGRAESLEDSLAPLAAWLAREGRRLPERTALRRLECLHGRWQAELEALRRCEWQRLMRRTQWLVAAGVIATPLPSADLLVLASANGLMLQEMARLWNCPWEGETLRAAALELGRAALALGLVEWSTQALVGALRLHHAGWLVGGTLQALSAAYLTRVVGHAMADVLALSSGVAEADLEAIRRQAPMLVARAAEAEKVDWPSFLQQGLDWLGQQAGPAGAASLQQTT